MSVDYIKFLTKVQEESLATLKQAQDASLTAFAQFREFTNSLPKEFTAVPTVEGLGSPTALVEQSFSYASKLLELRKEYALKVADLIATSQKEATDATVDAVKATTATQKSK